MSILGSDENMLESEPDLEGDPFELLHNAHFMQLLMAQLRPQQGNHRAGQANHSMDRPGRGRSSQKCSETD